MCFIGSIEKYKYAYNYLNKEPGQPKKLTPTLKLQPSVLFYIKVLHYRQLCYRNYLGLNFKSAAMWNLFKICRDGNILTITLPLYFVFVSVPAPFGASYRFGRSLAPELCRVRFWVTLLGALNWFRTSSQFSLAIFWSTSCRETRVLFFFVFIKLYLPLEPKPASPLLVDSSSKASWLISLNTAW